MVLPSDTTTHGRALGGTVLHWMDVCGAVAAMRFAREKVVTASLDHVDFLAPIDPGEVATVEAYVIDAGETSIDVRAEVDAGDPVSGEVRETTTSSLTFVALDDEDRPTAVTDLACPTEAERDRRDDALAQVEALVERVDRER